MLNYIIREHRLYRLINIIVLISFIFTSTTAYALPNKKTLFGGKSHAQRYVDDSAENLQEKIESGSLKLTVPAKLGNVIQSHKGKNKGLIVHIQDRHADEVAQLNIAAIVDTMNTNYGIDLLCLEGASDKLNTSFYDKFPDDKAKEATSKFFVKEGLFTGAEYYKITHKDKDIRAYGAENKKLYLEHLDSYKKSRTDRDKVIGFLKATKRELDKLKKHIYSRSLKIIDNKQKAYHHKSMELGDFVTYIANQAKKRKIDLSKYPNFEKFSKLITQEKNIDFKKAEDQRNALVKKLSELLKEDELKTLLANSLEFRLNKLSASSYYEYIEDTIASNKESININSYKQLLSYIEYIRASEKVDHMLLFDEIDMVLKAVKSSYYKNDTQKILDSYVEYAALIKDLYDFKLTSKSLDKLKNLQKDIDISDLLLFIKNQTQKYGLVFNIAQQRIDKTSFKNAIDYYELALKRDVALIDNTIRRMKLSGEDNAILITGGFHTQGIVNILKEKDLSYVVVCPNVGTGDCEKIYQRQMENKLPDASALLNFLTSMLADPLNLGNAADGAFAADMGEFFEATAAAIRAYITIIDEDMLEATIEEIAAQPDRAEQILSAFSELSDSDVAGLSKIIVDGLPGKSASASTVNVAEGAAVGAVNIIGQEELRREMALARRQIKQKEEELETLPQKREELEATLGSLEPELDAIDADVVEQEAEAELIREDIKRARKREKELAAQLEKARKDKGKYLRRVSDEDSQGEIARIADGVLPYIGDKRSELAKLRRKHRAKERSHTSLQESLAEDMDRLNTEIASLDAQAGALRGDIEQAKGQLARLQADQVQADEYLTNQSGWAKAVRFVRFRKTDRLRKEFQEQRKQREEEIRAATSQLAEKVLRLGKMTPDLETSRTELAQKQQMIDESEKEVKAAKEAYDKAKATGRRVTRGMLKRLAKDSPDLYFLTKGDLMESGVVRGNSLFIRRDMQISLDEFDQMARESLRDSANRRQINSIMPGELFARLLSLGFNAEEARSITKKIVDFRAKKQFDITKGLGHLQVRELFGDELGARLINGFESINISFLGYSGAGQLEEAGSIFSAIPALERSLKAVQTRQETLADDLGYAQEELKELNREQKKRSRAVRKAQKELEETKAGIRNGDRYIKGRKTRLARLSQRENVLGRVDALTEELGSTYTEEGIAGIEKRFRSLKKDLLKSSEVESLTYGFEVEVAEQRAEIARRAKEAERLREAAQKSQADAESYAKKVEEAKRELADLQKQLNAINEQLTYNDGSGYGASVLVADRRVAIEDQKQRIAAVKKGIEEQENRIRQLRKKLKSAKTEASELFDTVYLGEADEAIEKEVTDLIAHVAGIKIALERLEAIQAEHAERLARLAAEADSLRGDIGSDQENVTTIGDETEYIEAGLEIARIDLSIEKTERELEAANQSLSQYDSLDDGRLSARVNRLLRFRETRRLESERSRLRREKARLEAKKELSQRERRGSVAVQGRARGQVNQARISRIDSLVEGATAQERIDAHEKELGISRHRYGVLEQKIERNRELLAQREEEIRTTEEAIKSAQDEYDEKAKTAKAHTGTLLRKIAKESPGLYFLMKADLDVDENNRLRFAGYSIMLDRIDNIARETFKAKSLREEFNTIIPGALLARLVAIGYSYSDAKVLAGKIVRAREKAPFSSGFASVARELESIVGDYKEARVVAQGLMDLNVSYAGFAEVDREAKEVATLSGPKKTEAQIKRAQTELKRLGDVLKSGQAQLTEFNEDLKIREKRERELKKERDGDDGLTSQIARLNTTIKKHTTRSTNLKKKASTQKAKATRIETGKQKLPSQVADAAIVEMTVATPTQPAATPRLQELNTTPVAETAVKAASGGKNKLEKQVKAARAQALAAIEAGITRNIGILAYHVDPSALAQVIFDTIRNWDLSHGYFKIRSKVFQKGELSFMAIEISPEGVRVDNAASVLESHRDFNTVDISLDREKDLRGHRYKSRKQVKAARAQALAAIEAGITRNIGILAYHVDPSALAQVILEAIRNWDLSHGYFKIRSKVFQKEELPFMAIEISPEGVRVDNAASVLESHRDFKTADMWLDREIDLRAHTYLAKATSAATAEATIKGVGARMPINTGRDNILEDAIKRAEKTGLKIAFAGNTAQRMLKGEDPFADGASIEVMILAASKETDVAAHPIDHFEPSEGLKNGAWDLVGNSTRDLGLKVKVLNTHHEDPTDGGRFWVTSPYSYDQRSKATSEMLLIGQENGTWAMTAVLSEADSKEAGQDPQAAANAKALAIITSQTTDISEPLDIVEEMAAHFGLDSADADLLRNEFYFLDEATASPGSAELWNSGDLAAFLKAGIASLDRQYADEMRISDEHYRKASSLARSPGLKSRLPQELIDESPSPKVLAERHSQNAASIYQWQKGLKDILAKIDGIDPLDTTAIKTAKATSAAKKATATLGSQVVDAIASRYSLDNAAKKTFAQLLASLDAGSMGPRGSMGAQDTRDARERLLNDPHAFVSAMLSASTDSDGSAELRHLAGQIQAAAAKGTSAGLQQIMEKAFPTEKAEFGRLTSFTNQEISGATIIPLEVIKNHPIAWKEVFDKYKNSATEGGINHGKVRAPLVPDMPIDDFKRLLAEFGLTMSDIPAITCTGAIGLTAEELQLEGVERLEAIAEKVDQKFSLGARGRFSRHNIRSIGIVAEPVNLTGDQADFEQAQREFKERYSSLEGRGCLVRSMALNEDGTVSTNEILASLHKALQQSANNIVVAFANLLPAVQSVIDNTLLTNYRDAMQQILRSA